MRRFLLRILIWWFYPTHYLLRDKWTVEEAVEALNFGGVIEELAREKDFLSNSEIVVVFLTAASKTHPQLNNMSEGEFYFLERRLENIVLSARTAS